VDWEEGSQRSKTKKTKSGHQGGEGDQKGIVCGKRQRTGTQKKNLKKGGGRLGRKWGGRKLVGKEGEMEEEKPKNKQCVGLKKIARGQNIKGEQRGRQGTKKRGRVM